MSSLAGKGPVPSLSCLPRVPEAGLAAQGTPEPRASGQCGGEQTAQGNRACCLQVWGGVQCCFLKMGPHFPVRWPGGWSQGVSGEPGVG